ncbi:MULTISPECIES: ribonuclease P protein component [unclassified Corynebacterium]|uniref:ribonuclease P protein component n=1 Tax=unclassified Corynebacterium TaxID=2624378 RepID=UPI002A91DE03|nr:ribonuclease P protein component [Corynebacterium sp.]MDY5785678.1 ribonuclease P protein component [Corynebacterium sp.]
MLPKAHKLGSSADFRRVTRTGTRAGTKTLVVHLAARTGSALRGGPRFGLVVSKQVGNAVTRHAVSRKLRHVCREVGVDKLGRECDVVVRALPGAATATSDTLRRDLGYALDKAREKAEKKSRPAARGEQ